MIIFHNANIYAPENPTATAVVIDHGWFLALGSDKEILDAFTRRSRVINMQGRTIWPGLTDAHVHLRLLAESMAMVDCETSTRQECLSRVKLAADQLPADAWVRGHGWNQNLWAEGFGNAQMLDSVCGGRPAYLTAKSLHAAWANTTALRLAGIDIHTPDPPGGVVQRGLDGQPTGILIEAGAMEQIEAVIPQPSLADTIVKIKAVFPELWKSGLVGLHDFDDFSCWIALQSIFQDNTTPIRIRKQIPFTHLDAFISAGLRTGFGDDRLSLGGVKLFSDGALGPQTAAMFEPFENTENSGNLLLEEAELNQIGQHAVAHGISLAVHAIGDRANHVVLDAFEKLRAYEMKHHLPHLPHRIEHVQIIDPADLSRFAQLGIIASVQPVHTPSDMNMADQHLGKRTKNAYAYRSLRAAGAACVFGSDAPVEPFNPFLGLHAAVTRRRLDGSPGPEGWHAEQRLSLEEALNSFTYAPAEICGKGDRMGKISPGFHADFIILEEDPFISDPHALGNLYPLATFVAGECKYQSSSLHIDLRSNHIE